MTRKTFSQKVMLKFTILCFLVLGTFLSLNVVHAAPGDLVVDVATQFGEPLSARPGYDPLVQPAILNYTCDPGGVFGAGVCADNDVCDLNPVNGAIDVSALLLGAECSNGDNLQIFVSNLEPNGFFESDIDAAVYDTGVDNVRFMTMYYSLLVTAGDVIGGTIANNAGVIDQVVYASADPVNNVTCDIDALPGSFVWGCAVPAGVPVTDESLTISVLPTGHPYANYNSLVQYVGPPMPLVVPPVGPQVLHNAIVRYTVDVEIVDANSNFVDLGVGSTVTWDAGLPSEQACVRSASYNYLWHCPVSIDGGNGIVTVNPVNSDGLLSGNIINVVPQTIPPANPNQVTVMPSVQVTTQDFVGNNIDITSGPASVSWDPDGAMIGCEQMAPSTWGCRVPIGSIAQEVGVIPGDNSGYLAYTSGIQVAAPATINDPFNNLDTPINPSIVLEARTETDVLLSVLGTTQATWGAGLFDISCVTNVLGLIGCPVPVSLSGNPQPILVTPDDSLGVLEDYSVPVDPPANVLDTLVNETIYLEYTVAATLYDEFGENLFDPGLLVSAIYDQGVANISCVNGPPMSGQVFCPVPIGGVASDISFTSSDISGFLNTNSNTYTLPTTVSNAQVNEDVYLPFSVLVVTKDELGNDLLPIDLVQYNVGANMACIQDSSNIDTWGCPAPLPATAADIIVTDPEMITYQVIDAALPANTADAQVQITTAMQYPLKLTVWSETNNNPSDGTPVFNGLDTILFNSNSFDYSVDNVYYWTAAAATDQVIELEEEGFLDKTINQVTTNNTDQLNFVLSEQILVGGVIEPLVGGGAVYDQGMVYNAKVIGVEDISGNDLTATTDFSGLELRLDGGFFNDANYLAFTTTGSADLIANHDGYIEQMVTLIPNSTTQQTIDFDEGDPGRWSADIDGEPFDFSLEVSVYNELGLPVDVSTLVSYNGITYGGADPDHVEGNVAFWSDSDNILKPLVVNARGFVDAHQSPGNSGLVAVVTNTVSPTFIELNMTSADMECDIGIIPGNDVVCHGLQYNTVIEYVENEFNDDLTGQPTYSTDGTFTDAIYNNNKHYLGIADATTYIEAILEGYVNNQVAYTPSNTVQQTIDFDVNDPGINDSDVDGGPMEYALRVTVSDEIGNAMTLAPDTVSAIISGPSVLLPEHVSGNEAYFALSEPGTVAVRVPGYINAELTPENADLVYVEPGEDNRTDITLNGALAQADCLDDGQILAGTSVTCKGLEYNVKVLGVEDEVGNDLTSAVTITANGGTIYNSAFFSDEWYFAISENEDTLVITHPDYVVRTYTLDSLTNNVAQQRIDFDVNDPGTWAAAQDGDPILFPLRVDVYNELGVAMDATDLATLNVFTYGGDYPTSYSGNTGYWAVTPRNEQFIIIKDGYTLVDILAANEGLNAVSVNNLAQTYITLNEQMPDVDCANPIAAGSTLTCHGLQTNVKVLGVESETGVDISNLASFNNIGSSFDYVGKRNNEYYLAALVGTDDIEVEIPGYINQDVGVTPLIGRQLTIDFDVDDPGTWDAIEDGDGLEYGLMVSVANELDENINIIDLDTITYNSLPPTYAEDNLVYWADTNNMMQPLVVNKAGYVNGDLVPGNSGLVAVVTNDTGQTRVNLSGNTPDLTCDVGIIPNTTANCAGLQYNFKVLGIEDELEFSNSVNASYSVSTDAVINSDYVLVDEEWYVAVTGNGVTKDLTVSVPGMVDEVVSITPNNTTQQTIDFDVDDPGTWNADIDGNALLYGVKVNVLDQFGNNSNDRFDMMDIITFNGAFPTAFDDNTYYWAHNAGLGGLEVIKDGFVAAQTTNNGLLNIITTPTGQTEINLGTTSVACNAPITAGVTDCLGLEYGNVVMVRTYESNLVVNGATIEIGDGYGFGTGIDECFEDGITGNYYCPLPLDDVMRNIRVTAPDLAVNTDNAFPVDRTTHYDAQVIGEVFDMKLTPVEYLSPYNIKSKYVDVYWQPVSNPNFDHYEIYWLEGTSVSHEYGNLYGPALDPNMNDINHSYARISGLRSGRKHAFVIYYVDTNGTRSAESYAPLFYTKGGGGGVPGTTPGTGNGGGGSVHNPLTASVKINDGDFMTEGTDVELTLSANKNYYDVEYRVAQDKNKLESKNWQQMKDSKVPFTFDLAALLGMSKEDAAKFSGSVEANVYVEFRYLISEKVIVSDSIKLDIMGMNEIIDNGDENANVIGGHENESEEEINEKEDQDNDEEDNNENQNLDDGPEVVDPNDEYMVDEYLCGDQAWTEGTNEFIKLGLEAESQEVFDQVVGFIACGNILTEKYSMRERAGVIGDYYDTYERLPHNTADWEDIDLILSGHKPIQRSIKAEAASLAQFGFIFGRMPDYSKAEEELTLYYFAYKIRPVGRLIDNERMGNNFFAKIYGHYPQSSFDWSLARGISYGGMYLGPLEEMLKRRYQK